MRSTRVWIGVLAANAIFAGMTATAQQAPRFSNDVAMTFVAERAKIANVSCGCFWLEGGSAEDSIVLYRNLGVTANVTGEHASNIGAGASLGKVTLLAGPRYTATLPLGRGLRHHPAVFGEWLFGGAHAFDGVFPSGTATATSATAFAMQLGGGFDLPLRSGFALRVLEVDWIRSSLPNNGSNTQNDVRLAAGASFRFRMFEHSH